MDSFQAIAHQQHLRVLAEAGLVKAQVRGRERHYELDLGGLTVVQKRLDVLRPRVRLSESALNGLDLEVRRTVRDHRTTRATDSVEETS